jgi:chemotaxis signal transduction protein
VEANKGILLESGTNELEIVEFGLGKNKFGINVIKVKEIINPVPITLVPHSHPNVEGIIELRGEVLPVVNVADALRFPPSETPEQDEDEVQLVITDIEMPQMDGHHLTRRIKENGELAGLPVIIFSSLITDSLRHKGQVVGADAQISKPEIAELIQLIDRLVL